MNKKYFLIITFCFSLLGYSQKKTCNSPEETLEDLNSITKCKVLPSKKGKNKKAGQISVRVSVNKKRFLKKRKAKTLEGKGVATIKSIKNTVSISNVLSIEEVRKAYRFIDVDEIPAFKKCSALKGDERMECFNVEMVGHIQKYFNYPDDAIIQKIEGEVWIRFIIDTKGNVTNIKTHTDPKQQILEDEAFRVVANLKGFKPATKDGKPVSVKYGFPINFSLKE